MTNSNQITFKPILNDCAACFTQARRNLIQGAALLHKIKEEKLWEGIFDSFSEYLQDRCQISDGYASKVIHVYEHFVLQAGFSLRKIEEIDYEKLYMASKLPNEPETQLIKAETLSRSDLNTEVRLLTNSPCNHPENAIITQRVCTQCHHRVE